MRYIMFSGGNGYCGCDWEEVCVVDDDTTNRELDDDAYSRAMDYAEGYEHVAQGYDLDFGGWEDEESEEEYYQDITYNWVEITEEEYKNKLAE